MGVSEVYEIIDREWRRVIGAWEAQSGRPFPCKPGCSTCCKAVGGMPYTPLPMGPEEAWELWKAVRALSPLRQRQIATRLVVGHHQSCLLLWDDRCLVYEARPLWCRVYGLYGGEPICGLVPSEAIDADWVRAAQWAFQELRSSGDVVFIPDLVDALRGTP